MQPLHPVLPQRTDAEIDDPHIRQASRYQQPTQSLWVAQMALVDMEPTAFEVGEEGLDMRALFVPLEGSRKIGYIRDQVDRLFVCLLPDGQNADGAILFGGHPSRCDCDPLAPLRSQIT